GIEVGLLVPGPNGKVGPVRILQGAAQLPRRVRAQGSALPWLAPRLRDQNEPRRNPPNDLRNSVRWLIPSTRAPSSALSPSLSIRLRARATMSGLHLKGGPSDLPRALAAARPARALQDQVALELRHGAKHLQNELAGAALRGEPILHRAEVHAARLE